MEFREYYNDLRVLPQESLNGSSVMFTYWGDRVILSIELDGKRTKVYQSYKGTSGKQVGNWYECGDIIEDSRVRFVWIVKGDVQENPFLSKINSLLPHGDGDTLEYLKGLDDSVDSWSDVMGDKYSAVVYSLGDIFGDDIYKRLKSGEVTKDNDGSSSSLYMMLYNRWKGISVIEESFFGSRGLTVGEDLEDLSDYAKEVSYYAQSMDDSDYAEWLEESDDVLVNMWRNYRDSMNRRRPGTALDFMGFCGYISNPGVYAYCYRGSCVLGQFMYGVYKISHFCPNNQRSGVELLKSLLSYDNVVLFVTEDLIGMLERIGYYTSSSVNIEMSFRDSPVLKYVACSSKSLLMKAKILIGMYRKGVMDLHSLDNLFGGSVRDILNFKKGPENVVSIKEPEKEPEVESEPPEERDFPIRRRQARMKSMTALESVNYYLEGFIPSDIVIIPKKEWTEGKDDPTEYSYDDNIIRVRSDYDWEADPAGWMVHERVHKRLDDSGFVDDGKEYPENAVERKAYVEQFVELKRRGYSLEKVISLMPRKFDNYPDIMNQYWEEA